jgi:hypothetical protein
MPSDSGACRLMFYFSDTHFPGSKRFLCVRRLLSVSREDTIPESLQEFKG